MIHDPPRRGGGRPRGSKAKVPVPPAPANSVVGYARCDGGVWLCSAIDTDVTPERGTEWTKYVDRWAYARHDAATAEAILANGRPFRDLFTAAQELWRVEVTWTSTGGPQGQHAPTSTAARSTPETIIDGWLPDVDVYFRDDPQETER